MASRKEFKKRIKKEYRKLEEDIMQAMTMGNTTDKGSVQDLLDRVQKARDQFVKASNELSPKDYDRLRQEIVEDIDKNYVALKSLIEKK